MIIYTGALYIIFILAIGYGLYLHIEKNIPEKPYTFDTSRITQDIITRFLSYKPLHYAEDLVHNNVINERIVEDYYLMIDAMMDKNFNVVTDITSEHTLDLAIGDTKIDFWISTGESHVRAYRLRHKETAYSEVQDRLNNIMNSDHKALIMNYNHEARQHISNKYSLRFTRA